VFQGFDSSGGLANIRARRPQAVSRRHATAALRKQLQEQVFVRGVWGQSYAAVRQRVDDAAACEYSSRSVRAGATKVALLLQKNS
jgi:hypothetical protein